MLGMKEREISPLSTLYLAELCSLEYSVAACPLLACAMVHKH